MIKLRDGLKLELSKTVLLRAPMIAHVRWRSSHQLYGEPPSINVDCHRSCGRQGTQQIVPSNAINPEAREDDEAEVTLL